jgi:xylose isomerase
MYSFLLHKGTKLPQGATYMREQLPFKSISLKEKEKEKEKGIKLLWKLNNLPRTIS